MFLYQKFLLVGADIGELIDRFDQLGAGGFEEGDDFDAAAGGALDVVDQGDIVAVPAHQNDDVQAFGHLDGIDRDADVPVAFFSAAGKNLQILGLDFESLLAERFEEFFFLAFQRLDAVGDGADEFPVIDAGLQERAEISLLFVEDFGGIIEILDIDEHADPLFFEFCHNIY